MVSTMTIVISLAHIRCLAKIYESSSNALSLPIGCHSNDVDFPHLILWLDLDPNESSLRICLASQPNVLWLIVQ